MSWSVKTVWVKRSPDGRPQFETHPAASPTALVERAAGTRTFLVTNEVEALRELLADSSAAAVATALDVADLFRFAFPSSSAETAVQMIAPDAPSAAGLWQAWERLLARFSAMPMWALETIELALREAEEPDLAGFFGCCAAEARMQGKACGAWRDTFPAVVASTRAARRVLPSHEDCSPLDEAGVVALLGPDGPMSRVMPDYEPRAGQLEMLRAVVRAFNGAKHLLVEAGTGVGKSVAYLLPAALWARLNDVPVIVSTNTRNLQAQLLDKDLPLVRQVVDATDAGGSGPLRVALLKGRSNYLCLRRLGGLLEHGQFELERSDVRAFARTVAWAVQTPSGDLDELLGGSGMEVGFGARLASLGEECTGRACRFYRRCFLQQARERAAQAHVVIANHALVFADLSAPGTALPPSNVIVFDEAHNLEEAATRHFSIEVTPTRLATLLRRLSRGKGRHAGGVLETLRHQVEKGDFGADAEKRDAVLRLLRDAAVEVVGVQDAGQRLFRALASLSEGATAPRRFKGAAGGAGPVFLASRPSGEGSAATPMSVPVADANGWSAVAGALTGFKETVLRTDAALQALAQSVRLSTDGELSLHEDEALDLDACGVTLRTFALDADFVLGGSETAHVFWVQRARTREKLGEAWAAPLKIGPRLAAELYAKRDTVVFCSATLRVGSQFDFVAGRLGADQIAPERLSVCVAASPFDYPAQCAVLAPTFLPEPGVDGRAYAEQLSALMLEVFILTRGRALGLFTSYEMMRQCAGLLREPLEAEGIRLLVQGESGSRDQITRLFRDGGARVLLGTHSFWEGVDVVGDALSCVVMARLPFAAVGEPIHEARCELAVAEQGSGFAHFSLPSAVIRFRQGFGRLIRHRHDRGVVIVADPRVITRRYSGRFVRSLPCPVEAVADRDALLARVQAVLGDTPAVRTGSTPAFGVHSNRNEEDAHGHRGGQAACGDPVG